MKEEEESEKIENFEKSPVYLIERGGCSFVTKSRNAEESNGKVVIIYNNNAKEEVSDIVLMD